VDRIIIHIDMNSYFASVEQQANPLLRGKPIGITGKHASTLMSGQRLKIDSDHTHERSVITTASIEAKALGVKTAMSTWEAKKICPALILWSGDPHKYAAMTERFNRIYNDFTPRVQIFSVDESFLDVTEEAGDYFAATCMAQAIRHRLRGECGERITASIGIGPNKLMAKLASESVKPNGLTVVRPQELMKLLDSRELDDLCGIGPRIKHRLNMLGIETFKQLREFPLDHLKSEFNRYGIWLHEAAHGRESDVIIASTAKGLRGMSSETPKSYGHSYTLPRNTHDPLVVKHYLLGLADKVAWRMRRDNYAARRVTAFVRYGNFESMAQQRTLSAPTNDGHKLFQVAWKILSHPAPFSLREGEVSARGGSAFGGGGGCHEPVRLVGLSASKITQTPSQQSLFKKEQKMQSVLPALDSLQQRYGTGVWTRASLIKTHFKQRSSGFHFDHLV
jgi:DNA polymerase IV